MQVLHITTDGKARIINLDPENILAGLQHLVDGTVTCVGTDVINSGLALDIWANDEGLIREDFVMNELGSFLAGQYLVGPVVLAGIDDYGETASLGSSHMKVLRGRLKVKVDDNKGAGYQIDVMS